MCDSGVCMCVPPCVCHYIMWGGGGHWCVSRARTFSPQLQRHLYVPVTGGRGGVAVFFLYIFFTVRTARFTFDAKIEEQALVLLLW